MSSIITRSAALLLAAGAVIGLGAAPAFAATQSGPAPYSYPLTSSQYTVSWNPLTYRTYDAVCGTGFHIATTTQYVGHLSQTIEVPTLTTAETDHAKGDIYLPVTKLADQIGSSDGTPYFSTVDVTLGNHSWSTDHTGTFSWTCVENPSD